MSDTWGGRRLGAGDAGWLPESYLATGSSSFTEFVSQTAAHLLPGHRLAGQTPPSGGAGPSGHDGIAASHIAAHGTTIVTLAYDGGVLLAGDRRATMGNMIASKRAKKIYQITPRIGLTTAGGVGDAQQLVRIMQVECNIFEMRRGKTMSVGAASTLLSNYLNQNRYYPYYVQLLMGGFDDEGPSIYSVDALGGAMGLAVDRTGIQFRMAVFA